MRPGASIPKPWPRPGQVLALDDCNEAAHCAAMRAYASMGQRAAALAQYQRCRDALAREMAVSPYGIRMIPCSSAAITAEVRSLTSSLS